MGDTRGVHGSDETLVDKRGPRGDTLLFEFGVKTVGKSKIVQGFPEFSV